MYCAYWVIKSRDSGGNLNMNDQPRFGGSYKRGSQIGQAKIRLSYSIKSTKISSEAYMTMLKRRKGRISRIRRGKKPMPFQLCNSRTHAGARTSAAIEIIGSEVVPHPSYSPGLAPSDFCLFVALSKHLKGVSFMCD
jgi:histone-lysine N-methyltransferase SETMAR